jgi:hypothetical protein
MKHQFARSFRSFLIQAPLLLLAFILFSPQTGLAQPSDPQARSNLRARMEQVMGSLPSQERRTALDIKFLDETDCGKYIRRFISYQSEPGSRVSAYLLIPKNVFAGKSTAFGMLCLHQTHAQGQKVVVGLGDSPNDEYGVELAERGFVCIAPPYPLLADYAPDLQALGYASGTMKAIWDNIRALDVMETLPYVKKGSYGAIGHSLGGHNAIFTACFEPRIKVVVSSCGFDSFSDYMNGNIKGWTSQRYMPRLLNYPLEQLPFDFPDLIRSLAPRGLFVYAPIGDTNFKWKSVDRVVAEALPAYKAKGAAANIVVKHPDAAHSFPKEIREEAYDFIGAMLPMTESKPK